MYILDYNSNTIANYEHETNRVGKLHYFESHRREVALYNIDMYTTADVLITGGVPYLSRFSTWVLRT